MFFSKIGLFPVLPRRRGGRLRVSFPRCGTPFSLCAFGWFVSNAREGEPQIAHTQIRPLFPQVGLIDLGAGATFFHARRESLFPFLLVPVGKI